MKIQKKELKESENHLKTYARLSSIGIQMFAIIAIGTYSGFKLDQIYTDSKLFTTVCALVSVVVAIVYVVRRIISDTTNN
jgi:F0F1-type ATP synthase assembly protein I